MRVRRRDALATIGLGLASASACVGLERRIPSLVGDDPLGEAAREFDGGRFMLDRDLAIRRLHRSALLSSALALTGSIEAAVLHDRALERLLRLTGGPRRNLDAGWLSDVRRAGVRLSVAPSPGIWEPDRFDRLEFSDDHTAFPIREVHRREGWGLAMFSVRRRQVRERTRLQGADRFLPPWEVHPITLRLRADGAGGSILEAVDPLNPGRTPNPPGAVRLAFDLSTPLAYHFARSGFPVRERVMMLDPDQHPWSAGMQMLHPYQPGKIPVVFIHGYWANPSCWLQTINELQGDPAIRARHQFWLFTYPSMNPYLHSAALLRRSLREARRVLDPDRQDPALGRMVLVGHSLGGILAKTAAVDPGDALWSLVGREPIDALNATDDEKAVLREVFLFPPEPDVGRVVFISTPHRGSPLSSRIIGRIAGRLTPHKGPLGDLYADLLRNNRPDAFTPLFREEGIATSFDQLREGDAVLEALDRAPFANGVGVHSIVAQRLPGPAAGGFDGVVHYASSHLPRADSELIVRHHHFVQGEPPAIAELKRILSLG